MGFWQCADDVRVTGISDRQGAHAEIATACGSELDVISVVVMNAGLGQHRVVFDLGFSKWIQETLSMLYLQAAMMEPLRRRLRNVREIDGHLDYSIAFPSESYFSVTEMTPYGSIVEVEKETLLLSNLIPHLKCGVLLAMIISFALP